MRELEFRGKHKRLGVWVYGYYTHLGKLHLIHVDKTYITGTIEHGGAYEIEPETIGQFTGLCDCKGQEIYEGDIIKTQESEIGIIVWETDLGGFRARLADGSFYTLTAFFASMFSVIGNVHDNPALLEVEHD